MVKINGNRGQKEIIILVKRILLKFSSFLSGSITLFTVLTFCCAPTACSEFTA